MLTLNVIAGMVDDYYQYHQLLYAHIWRRFNEHSEVLESIIEMEKNTEIRDEAANLKFLVYDLLEWLIDPMNPVKYKNEPETFKTKLFKSSERPFNLEDLKKRYGVAFTADSTLMKMNIKHLMMLCAYKFNIAYEISEFKSWKNKTWKRRIQKFYIGLDDSGLEDKDYLKLRENALFNEIEAFKELFIREHKDDVVLRRTFVRRQLYTQEGKGLESLGKVAKYHLRNQTKIGNQGFSEFYEKLREQFHSYLETHKLRHKDPLQVDEIRHYIDTNPRAIRELILEEENDFLNLLVKKTYAAIFGNRTIFSEEHSPVRKAALNILLYHRPIDAPAEEKKRLFQSLKYKNYSSMSYFLCKHLPNEERFHSSKRIIGLMTDDVNTQRIDNRLSAFGYEISLINNPVDAFFDAMDNYCLTGGSYERFMHYGVQPALMRDFGLDYIVNDSLFNIFGFRAFMDDGERSAVLAKANTFFSQKVIRLGNKEHTETVLVVDDVPGIDGLVYMYDDWIENMYLSIMDYAVKLRESGVKIDSVLFNTKNSKSQKSVKQFAKYVRQRQEAFQPETKTFELMSDGRVVDSFNYNFEIRTEKVKPELLQKLRKGGYDHYVGQHYLDVTYGWYEFMERNLEHLPQTLLYGSFTETKGEIEELIESNNRLFTNRAPRAAFNFGNGLINAIEINLDAYLGKPIPVNSNFFSAQTIQKVKDYA